MITDLAWWTFKTGFGLLGLALVWGRAVVQYGALWAKDTEEEKRALSKGA